MSARASRKSSETDWERVDAQSDASVDTTDVPPLPDDFFERATLRGPKSSGTAVAVTVSIDPDLLAWYRRQGSGWEQRMAAALRIYADAHRATAP